MHDGESLKHRGLTFPSLLLADDTDALAEELKPQLKVMAKICWQSDDN